MEETRCMGLPVRQSAMGNCCLITSGSGDGGCTCGCYVSMLLGEVNRNVCSLPDC